jgi:hypothetical protein
MTGRLASVSTLTSFVASLIALRLAGRLARSRQPVWAAGLLTYAIASAALAWGSAHGWDARAFRVYYLAGGLLTAPLLGAGSLLLAGRRWATPVALAYAGLAAGVALAMPVHGTFGSTTVPTAADYLGTLPRVVAIAGNSVGTLAVVAVALLTIRRRPVGNVLLLAGIAVAAAGSGLAGTDISLLATCAAIAAVLLYAGVAVGEDRFTRSRRRAAC